MANEPITTIIGNLTDTPELRYLQGGQAVCNFTIASTPRTLNRQTNQWEDGEPMFVRCSVWREYAENVAESLTKGTRVVAFGRLSARNYEYNGEKRTAIEMQVDEVGPALRYARAQVVRQQAGNAPQASQDRFSAPQTQNAPSYQSGAYNAPQTTQNDPAGNLAQAGLWGGSDQRAPF